MTILQRFIKKIITSEMMKEIKEDLIKEMQEDKSFKDAIGKLKIKTNGSDAYNIMETQDITSIVLKLTVVDSANMKRNFEYKFTSITQFINFVKRNEEWQDVKNEGEMLQAFDILVWFVYKKEVQLQGDYIIHGTTHMHNIDEIRQRLISWSKKHPDLLI